MVKYFITATIVLLVSPASLDAQVMSDRAFAEAIPQRTKAVGQQLCEKALKGQIYGYQNPGMDTLVSPETMYNRFLRLNIYMFEKSPDYYLDTVIRVNLVPDSVWGDFGAAYSMRKDANGSMVSAPVALAPVVPLNDYPYLPVPVFWMDLDKIKANVSAPDFEFILAFMSWKFVEYGGQTAPYLTKNSNWKLWLEKEDFVIPPTLQTAKNLGDFAVLSLKSSLHKALLRAEIAVTDTFGRAVDLRPENIWAQYAYRMEIQQAQNPLNPDDPTDMIDTMVRIPRTQIDEFHLDWNQGKVRGIMHLHRYNFIGDRAATDAYFVDESEIMKVVHKDVYFLWRGCLENYFLTKSRE